jgi:hypothetical protein
VVCKARLGGRSVHRPHHELCPNNRRSKGVTSKATLLQMQIDKTLRKHFETPLKPSERMSSKNATKEAGQAFFAKRKVPPKQNKEISNTNIPTAKGTTTTSTIDFDDIANMLCKEVTELVNTPAFCDGHASNRAPLAMLALAGVVMEKKSFSLFHGLTMTVPACKGMHDSPHYHSIVGQRLLLVDWTRQYGIDIQCPHCEIGILKNDRSNFSKNKALFPIFGLDGPPSWCMVMSMTCPSCRYRHT